MSMKGTFKKGIAAPQARQRWLNVDAQRRRGESGAASMEKEPVRWKGTRCKCRVREKVETTRIGKDR